MAQTLFTLAGVAITLTLLHSARSQTRTSNQEVVQ